MQNRPQKFNYTQWGFLIGTPVAVIAAVSTVVTVPAIGCMTRLTPNVCSASLHDVELIAQAETGEPLSGVKIQVIAQGAPEVQYTDNNGYAKVQVPSEGDVRVTLTQAGYPVQDFNINVENAPSTVRVVRFSKSGQPDIELFSIDTDGDPLPRILRQICQGLAHLRLFSRVEEFSFSLKAAYRKMTSSHASC